MTEPEKTADRHVDEITLLLYVERQLDRERAQEVSLHTQTCTRCLTMLRALDRESRLLARLDKNLRVLHGSVLQNAVAQIQNVSCAAQRRHGLLRRATDRCFGRE